MSLPESFKNRLSLPAVAAPMFLVSGPELVIETCKAGVVGTFPALNQRSSEGFEEWLIQINEALGKSEKETGRKPAPFGVNLIVHATNPRVEADLELCVKHKVPLVITSLGAVKDVVDAIHSYGGVVFHDVTNIRHAVKAASAGVDGLILVCAGAGGHAGVMNPFALLPQVREFFNGTILLAGAISDGRGIAAARMLGADLAYLGTRFIATKEAMASDGYKEMIVSSTAADIIYTPAISGIPASFLRPSIKAAGLDPDKLPPKPDINMNKELNPEARAWKNIWSAGQGVGSIDDVPSVADLVQRLKDEYAAATGAFLEAAE